MAVDKKLVKDYAIRLGDDALVLGHRLSEWCGNGPFLEEDLALANVALDYLGRARMFFNYAQNLLLMAPPRIPTHILATAGISGTS